jgi:hypothetical protein
VASIDPYSKPPSRNKIWIDCCYLRNNTRPIEFKKKRQHKTNGGFSRNQQKFRALHNKIILHTRDKFVYQKNGECHPTAEIEH